MLYGIIEHHQLVLSLNDSLYQEVRYRCILYPGIVSQAQIIVVPNIYIKKFTKPSKCTLPRFDENFSKFCTAKHKYTLADKR